MNELTSQPTNQPINQLTNKRTNEPTKKLTSQPTNQSTNQPTNQSTNQLMNELTSQPTNQSTNQLMNELTSQPTNQPTKELTSQPTNQSTNQTTNSMEQSPSWEANRYSASQEILSIPWNQNVHDHTHNSPPPVLILTHSNTVYTSPSHFLKTNFKGISHLRLGLPSGLFPSGLLTKTLNAPLLPPYALYAQSISFFFIWTPEYYLLSSTDHKVPRHVVFSTPLLHRPS